MIKLKNLTHCFNNLPPVFSEITLDIQKGEKILLTGANGSGKTTLLRILSGLLEPSTGDVSINNLAPFHPAIRSKLTYIPAAPKGLFPRLTIYENILFFSRSLALSATKLEQRLEGWSHIKLLQESLFTPFYQCSTGMKKVALVFILTLHSPEILIIDELFENIDTITQNHLINIINTIFCDSTIILTSHRDVSHPLGNFRSWQLIGDSIVS